MTEEHQVQSAPRAPEDASDQIRSQAESVGANLSLSFTALVNQLPGAPLGPRLLSERMDMTIGTASRFLRAIAESGPIDALQDIPGPAPLRQFLKAAKRERMQPELIKDAAVAVTGFEELIRQLGGNRSAVSSVLAAWQPRGRTQFVLRRRQAVFRALAELNGISLDLQSTAYVFHPSEREDRMDLLILESEIGLTRSRPDASFYIGSRRQAGPGDEDLDRPEFLTLDGESATGDMQSIRLEGFSTGPSAPIQTTQVGDEVIHTLGPTGVGSKSRSDLVLATVVRRASRRRDGSDMTDPLHVFEINATPSKQLCLDLLIHEDVIPPGNAELIVYSTIPRGPVTVGDPARFTDEVQVPERLEIGNSGLESLHLKLSPRYVSALEHCLGKLGWDPSRFCSWRVQVPFPAPGSQYCICIGRNRSAQKG